MSPRFRGGPSGLRPACVEKRIANQDLVRVKACNLLIGQGQQLAQELFVMLAETISSDVAAIRPSGKFHRQPGDVEFADRLVPDPPDRSALAQMRMGHGLVQSENRRAGHTFRLQRRNGRIAARKTAEPALDDVLERGIVVPSPPPPSEPRSPP